MKTSGYFLGRYAAVSLTVAVFALTACDSGVEYEGEVESSESAEPVAEQDVGSRKSLYGKAVDNAENLVEQENKHQEELLEMMETSEQ